jgi:hypothetical protein
MPTQRGTIIKKTLEILENRPNEIRYADLFCEIKDQLPEVPENTILSCLQWNNSFLKLSRKERAKRVFR